MKNVKDNVSNVQRASKQLSMDYSSKKNVFSFNINEIILKKIKKKMNKNRSGAIG